MLTTSKLDFWIENGLNVLLKGKHGTGKTSRVIDAFKRHGLRYAYFSVPTMDPWVDFVGVPRPTMDENGQEYLKIIQQKQFADGEIDAIFLDEFNRGSDKVRNAVMELIQFKSINGKPFPNLKLIIAAINEDKVIQYDVADLDAAQADRFQVHVNVPYEIDLPYFASKYGDDVAQKVRSWWSKLDEATRNDVSPRRVDYAIEHYYRAGDVADILPNSANISYFKSILESQTIEVRLANIFNSKDTTLARKLLQNDTMFHEAKEHIVANEEYTEFFLPLVNPEKVAALITEFTTNDDKMKLIGSKYSTSPMLHKCLYDSQRALFGRQERYKIIESLDFGESAADFNTIQYQDIKINTHDVKLDDLKDIAQFINTPNHTVDEYRDAYKDWIKNKFSLTGEHAPGSAGFTMFLIGKALLASNSNGQLILDTFPNVMSVFNMCVKHLNVDIRTETKYKILANRIIESGLGAHVWTPN